MMDMKRLSIVASLPLMFLPFALFGAQGVQLPTLPSGELPNSEEPRGTDPIGGVGVVE